MSLHSHGHAYGDRCWSPHVLDYLEIRMDAAKTMVFFTLKETFNSFKIFFKIQGFPNKICKAIKKKLMNVFETGKSSVTGFAEWIGPFAGNFEHELHLLKKITFAVRYVWPPSQTPRKSIPKERFQALERCRPGMAGSRPARPYPEQISGQKKQSNPLRGFSLLTVPSCFGNPGISVIMRSEAKTEMKSRFFYSQSYKRHSVQAVGPLSH